MSELSVLAEYIVNLNLEDIPLPVKEAAIIRVLDTIGTAIGAASDSQVQAVTRQWLKKDGDGRNQIWGTGKTATLSTSVFLNAMMGHTQELDDVHTSSKTHIGTVVVPAAWGMAEYLGCNGNDCLLAVICGYEVMSRIGMAFGVSAHRNLGWHVTATAGTFGAAAAAGRLLRLDKEKMIHALGLAGAQSFGTWAFLEDGSTSKSLNPARAAQSGIEAALLADAGMTGPEHVLTTMDGGILGAMSNKPEPAMAVDRLGARWQILDVDNKPYPSCRSTHCTIDATLELCRKYKIEPEYIDHINVETYLVGYKQCGASEGSIRPVTPVNAKFSSPFTVACSILYGEVTLAQFTEDIIREENIQDMMKKIIIIPTDEFTDMYPAHWGCRVIISMADGRCYESMVKDASGSADNPLTRKQVRDKAAGLMRSITKEKTDAIADSILNIDTFSELPGLS